MNPKKTTFRIVFATTLVLALTSGVTADTWRETVQAVAPEPADLVEQLERLMPLPRHAIDLRRQVIASLPAEGEVKVLSREDRRKIESLLPVLKLHGRETDYLFKVVELSQARIAIYARFVVL